mmetsp:Transcript_474/g.1264  ORF Transcript_474/g.1264 Transcript_474/m.1264 type:complete len:532 (+) Transcript_474:156-1751(+)
MCCNGAISLPTSDIARHLVRGDVPGAVQRGGRRLHRPGARHLRGRGRHGGRAVEGRGRAHAVLEEVLGRATLGRALQQAALGLLLRRRRHLCVRAHAAAIVEHESLWRRGIPRHRGVAHLHAPGLHAVAVADELRRPAAVRRRLPARHPLVEVPPVAVGVHAGLELVAVGDDHREHGILARDLLAEPPLLAHLGHGQPGLNLGLCVGGLSVGGLSDLLPHAVRRHLVRLLVLGAALAALRAPAASHAVRRIVERVVLRRVPVLRLVALEQVLHALVRARGAHGGLALVRLARVAGAVEEGAERPPLAVALAAEAGLVELGVVQLLLASVRQVAGESAVAPVLVRELRRAARGAAGPLRAGPRGVADERRAAPVPVGVGVHAVLPVVGPADGAPLRLELVGNEVLRRRRLLGLPEVRHQELAAGVGEGAEGAAGAAVRLVAEALAEDVRVVEELRGVVAGVALVAAGAEPLAVELLVAELGGVSRLAPALGDDRAAAVALAVVVGAAAVVVRGPLEVSHVARHRLELVNHHL